MKSADCFSEASKRLTRLRAVQPVEKAIDDFSIRDATVGRQVLGQIALAVSNQPHQQFHLPPALSHIATA